MRKATDQNQQHLARQNPEAGFGVTLIAITIAIIMGISVSIYMQQVSTQGLQFQDSYTASQAKWSALSGIEYGLYKSELGEADFAGPYTFYNSTIAIDTSLSNESGGPLADFYYRVISTGSYGDSERIMRIIAKMSMKTVWGDVSIIEGTGTVSIQAGVTLDDSLYIGQNVTVSGGTIGSTTHTHLYVPPGKSVSPATGTNYTSGQHPRGWLFSPDFNTDPYDSLLGIAYAIGSDNHTPPNNLFSGNERIRNTTLNLNSYYDSTIYIKGKLTLQGVTVTGGDATRPAVIVATTDIIAESRSGTETTFGDNIVLIADDDINIYDATTFGLDHSALTPPNRPETFNMMYGFDLIEFDNNVEVWSSTFSNDDIRLDGSTYGIIYAPDKFTLKQSGSYLEGAIFAHKIIGNNGENRIDRGQLNLNHYFNQDFFKTYDFGVSDNSLYEL